MCYNCGCNMPDNDMGDANNITDETFEKAAKASGQPLKEALENTKELIEEKLASLEQK
jgi:hypothetical protein